MRSSEEADAEAEEEPSWRLLAFERDFIRLHRKIARKSPTC